MFRDGKPRYWIAGYDGKFLVVPVLLALVIAGIIWLPQAPAPKPVIAPPPPPAMAPTLVLQPAPGNVVPANETFTLSGSAEPGSVVRLNYFQTNVDHLLGEQTAATNGGWAFNLSRLQAGSHTFRVLAFKAGRTMPSGEVTYTSKPVPRPPAAKKPAPAKPAKKK
jgi:hypothetical protein